MDPKYKVTEEDIEYSLNLFEDLVTAFLPPQLRALVKDSTYLDELMDILLESEKMEQYDIAIDLIKPLFDDACDAAKIKYKLIKHTNNARLRTIAMLN